MKIRIGNDIQIKWSIYDDNKQPYILTSDNLLVTLKCGIYEKDITDYTIENNTLLFTFYGKDQTKIGTYTLTLVENNGEDGMKTVDSCKAFKLVASSCETNSCSEINPEIETIMLQSNLQFVGSESSGSIQIVVDSILSTTSENPVQNKVVTLKINDIENKINTESNRAKTAEQSLDSKIYNNTTKIDNEITRAKSVEESLDSKIYNNTNNIANEITRAKDAESGLSSNISSVDDKLTAEVNRATSAENDLSNAISEAEKRMFRKLFEGIGVEYNDTNEEIEKTAPWKLESFDASHKLVDTAATVKHLPGYYFYNGLNLTEEEMINIFTAGKNPKTAGWYYGMWKIKTNIPSTYNGSGSTISAVSLYNGCQGLVVARPSSVGKYYCDSLVYTFNGCKKLKYIVGEFIINTTAAKTTEGFTNCLELEFIRLGKLRSEVSFKNSPKLSKGSLYYMIVNNAATATITITVHPTVYAAYFNEDGTVKDADIEYALTQKTNVTIISA